MKRLFTLLLISFATLSCEMIDEKLDDLLDKRDWVVFAEGTELTANVPSKQTVLNYKFESTLDWEVKTDTEWLEIDPTSGKAGKDIKIQIKVAKNKDKEGRTGYVDLTLSNDESYRITINQAGEDDENDEGDENEGTIVDVPANQIWYTSTDGEVVEPYSGEYNEYAEAITTFGVNIVSNTYVDGKGVIEFEGDVTTIGDWAFAYCYDLTSVTIPDSVTTIGDWAFCGCSSLTSVTIGDSVTTIGVCAFGGCENLEAVHITDLVSWCNIDFINPFTDGRVDLSANPLCYAHNLYLNGELVTDLVIPDGVNEIKLMAFASCESIKSVTIPDSVTSIGNYAFFGCTGELIINSKIIETNYEYDDSPSNSWLNGVKFTKLTIGDSIKKIGVKVFQDCSSLTSVTIGDSVTSIGEYAFAGCSSLTSVTITDSVTTIGERAFADCASLESVTIPDSVTTIGEGAFISCSSLTCVTIGDSVNTIGDYAFEGCSSLTSVTIPDSVTEIGYMTFYGCTGELIINSKIVETDYTYDNNPSYYDWLSGAKFTILTIGDGIEKIGGFAFWDCDSLTSVTIGDSVTEIGYCAFEGCSSLTSVTIPDSVTTIGYYAFADCKSITSVTIPNSVTTIGNGAFLDCNSLTSVTIPDSVTEIGHGAFCWCDSLQEFNGKFASEDGRCLIIDGTLNSFAPAGLTEYTISNSVTTIGDNAFQYCDSLTSVTIGDSVTMIGGLTFDGCTSLTSVTIPDSVTSIGVQAFCSCSSLTSVYCKATTPPAGGYDMFSDNASGRKIYVPMESVDAYKSEWIWSEYASSIEGYNF